LNYNLFLDSNRSTIWGDGTGSTSYVSAGSLLAVGTSNRQYTVYGRVPAGQDRGAGSYTDTIVVTLNY
jgi:spore coat protein U-like protein